MIKQISAVASPANVIFSKYLGKIDEHSLTYTKYTFYEVEGLGRQETVDAIKGLDFHVKLQLTVGREDEQGGILAEHQSKEKGIGPGNKLHLYSYFGSRNQIILYLSGRNENEVEEYWAAILKAIPLASTEVVESGELD